MPRIRPNYGTGFDVFGKCLGPVLARLKKRPARIQSEGCSGARTNTIQDCGAGSPLYSFGKTRTHQDREPSPLGQVKPTVHILAGLERQSALLGHRHSLTIARIAPRARVTLLDREHPKAAQLHPIPSRQSGRDRAQDRIDDDLNIPLVQVRVLLRDPLDQFRLEHRSLTPKRSAPEGAGSRNSWPAPGVRGIRPALHQQPSLKKVLRYVVLT